MDAVGLVSDPLNLLRSGSRLVMEALRETRQGHAQLWFEYTVSDPCTIYLMVRGGLGVPLMPRAMLPDDLDGMLPLPLFPVMPFRVGMGVRSWEAASPVAKLFTQTAEAWATSHGLLG